jgi:hypothetical protein
MKIRNGFVSNSSSSSFLMYGIFDDDLDYSEREDLASQATDLGLHAWNLDHGIYIGLSWDEVANDETGAEFKDRVQRLLVMLLERDPKDLQIRTHQEEWYD